MITLRELEPKSGEEVTPYWRKLLAFAKQRDVVSAGAPCRIRETVNGTMVVFEPSNYWVHPFQCTLVGQVIRILPGYLDAEMPKIGDLYLDGRDEEGEMQTPPFLELPENAAPGDDGRSFVCLQLAWAPVLNVPLALEVVHVGDLALAREEFAEAGALEPLAVLYWDEKRERPAHLRQIVHHHLKHLHIAPSEEDRGGEEEERGRHFFFAT